jgi:hypothetical protein
MPLNKPRAREEALGKLNSNQEGTAMLVPLLLFLGMFASMAVESRKFWARAIRSPVDSGNRGLASDNNGFKPVVFRADE